MDVYFHIFVFRVNTKIFSGVYFLLATGGGALVAFLIIILCFHVDNVLRVKQLYYFKVITLFSLSISILK